MTCPPAGAELDAAWLRARLIGHDPADAIWSDDPEHLPHPHLIPAAVLVGIVTGAAPGVLLTKRTATLRRHAGQVSFPGGRIDAGDSSPEEAALREAHEEIGLEMGFVETIGRLADHITGTGYRITPVLALVSPGFTTTLSAEEVEAVFELPLAVVMDPAAPEHRQAEFGGRKRHYWVWPHPEHFVWGATAAILMQLARRLEAAAPPLYPAKDKSLEPGF